MSSKGGEEQDLLLGDVVHERASEVIKFILSESKDGGNLSRHIIKDYGHDTDDNSNLHPKKILYWQHHRASMFINYLLEVTTIPSHANASSFTLVLKSVQLGNMPTEAEEKVRPLSNLCRVVFHSSSTAKPMFSSLLLTPPHPNPPPPTSPTPISL